MFNRRPIIRLRLSLRFAIRRNQSHGRTQRIRDESTKHLALLAIINTQHGHKAARLVHDGRALALAFFAHDAVAIPAVVGGGGAVHLAHGLVDPAAQAVVAVGGLRGMAIGAGVGELYQAVGAIER